MNMTITTVLPAWALWLQYSEAAKAASAADVATCHVLEVLAYGAELDEDHAAVTAAMAKAERFAALAANAANPVYRDYCGEQIEEALFAAWALAHNPRPMACGLRFFAA